MLELLWEAVLDSVRMLPFLFAAYLLIEYLEHRSAGKLERGLARYGSVGGALLGCVPQCGFSVAAANLYAGQIVTAGTLISVFISTSDEAIPVLLSNPGNLKPIVAIICIKVVIAIIAGIGADLFLFRMGAKRGGLQTAVSARKRCHECGFRHGGGIMLSAFRHTISIFLYILIFTMALNIFIHFTGEDSLRRILLSGSILQPVVAGLVGLIPNCAASVMLTELYTSGSLSFGALTAGLCTGAGAGLIVLFKANKNLMENFKIILYIYAVGVAAGLILQII